jgi:Flp pilus assembly protein TadG
MLHGRSCKVGRKGVILPLSALLVVVILGMAAFSVDIGYVIFVESELQNAADASALAGAAALMNPYVQYSYPNQTSSAKATILASAISSATSEAQRLAALNKAGDVSSLTANASDIVCGFLNAQNTFSPMPPDSRFPNSVQVTLRRDNQANTPLCLFFASIFGKTSANLTATAQATMMSSPGDFSSAKNTNSTFLPVALDVRIWSQFLQNGTSPSANNQVMIGPNGALELQVYPDSTQFGSFGLTSIGAPANDTPSYSAWIDNGPSSGDLRYLKNNSLLPVSPSAPQYWYAGPGMKSTLQSDFASVIGQPRLIPLYDGSLATDNGYPIIGFAGVTISEATGDGSNMNISVQPAVVSDPTAVGGVPAGTGSLPPTFSFSGVQLTR